MRTPSLKLSVCAALMAVVLYGCQDPAGSTAPDLPVRAGKAAGGTTTTGPVVSSTNPSSSVRNVTLNVRILGSGFDRGSTAQWAIKGVPSAKVKTNSTTYVSQRELVANITIAADADVTLYDVIVTTGSGKPGIGTESFEVTLQVTDVGTLSGDLTSLPWAVNNEGYVLGFSYADNYAVQRYFIKSGNTFHVFPGGGLTARAISNGTTAFLAGSTVPNNAARLTFNPATGFSAPTVLDNLGGYMGQGQAVNDVGDVSGWIAYSVPGGYTYDAVIWKMDGTTTKAVNPNPAMYPRLEARDINNSGHTIIHCEGPGPERGYVRMVDGTMIELPPLAGHVSTLVAAMSEVNFGKMYVVGNSSDDAGNYTSVRWTIDVATSSILTTLSRTDRSTASGIGDDGTVVGTIQGVGNTQGYLWRQEWFMNLRPPSGGTSSRGRAISSDGRFILGDAKHGSNTRAALWSWQ
ncbi:MAG TPA: hypothetical protein VM939_13850 [Gemmatimonadaceae bacterium]|nr:hypothetical protein [Gemmatimonadaceae bacterium]